MKKTKDEYEIDDFFFTENYRRAENRSERAWTVVTAIIIAMTVSYFGAGLITYLLK